jgi:hypothetical protein
MPDVFNGDNLKGMEFGRFTVLSFAGLQITPSGQKPSYWNCSCSCGNPEILKIKGCDLKTGNHRSCGCLQREIVTQMKTTHGGSETKLYQVWLGMKRRCLNKRNDDYRYYGGRGIKICNRWMRFDLFRRDMGDTWKLGLTIERKNNNGNYCPSNCVWETRKGQYATRRTKRDRLGKFRNVC